MTTPRKAAAKPKLAAVNSDVDVLDPKQTVVTLQSGLQVEIVPLKSRQLFKLLRIVTHGMGDSIQAFRLDSEDSDEGFGIKLVTMIAFAIPEAEDQAFDFIASMAKPVGLIERSGLTEADKERNIELMTNFLNEMDNPEIEDAFTIIETVVMNEAPNLKALGKRLGTMLKTVMGGKKS